MDSAMLQIEMLRGIADMPDCPPPVKESALAMIDLIRKERELVINSMQKHVDVLKAENMAGQGKVLVEFYQRHQDLYSDLSFLTGRVIVALKKLHADLSA